MKKFLLDLDCIATRLNRLTDRYFSLAREEEAEGMNLFAQRRGNVIHWLHPHPGQLRKCLRYTQIALRTDYVNLMLQVLLHGAGKAGVRMHS